MTRLASTTWLLLPAIFAGFGSSATSADEFLYRTEAGENVRLEGKLLGSGQGVLALELADGSVKLVPQALVMERKPTDGPTPLTPEQMAAELEEKFGKERFRSGIKQPFVCGLVLAAPLTSRVEESRARAFLKKAADFMKRIETVFETFARTARIPLEDPRYPLVALIFETDEDFEAYAEEITGGRGLSAGNIAGFYSGLTNILVLRMSECHTFETPLHEAIHQQVYNRKLIQRLSPAPAWFNEGLATAFEGNGDRISNGPTRVNAFYARRAGRRSALNWDEVVEHDAAFRGDIFASDAYMHGWGLHWMTLNHYSDEYRKYVAHLASLEPLTKRSSRQQWQDFVEYFGKEPTELQIEFPERLKAAVRRQRLPAQKNEPAGFSSTRSNLADVELTAVRQASGLLNVKGRMMNISPLRNMSYYITVETSAGEYADWYLPDIAMRKTVVMTPQVVLKRMAGSPGGIGGSFRVRVKSCVVDSDTAKAWARGQLPVPVFRN